MNINNYPVSEKYKNKFPFDFDISSDTTVEQLKNKKERTFLFKMPVDHPGWGKLIQSSIEYNNEELVRYVVKTCGKQILARHFTDSHPDVPLSCVKTAKMTQLLINLGADININYELLTQTGIGVVQKRMSPFHMILRSYRVHSKIEKEIVEVVKIIKCFIRNHILFEQDDLFWPREKEIVKLAFEEIAVEDKGLRDRGVVLLSALQDDKSFVFTSRMNRDIMSSLCQKMIDIHDLVY